MTKSDIKEIFRNIVRTFPDIPCQQLNTFFIIDDGTEFETENLGSTYADFKTGDFWSRNWVVSGAHEDTLCKQYPILGIEQKRLHGPELLGKEFCLDYWIVLADVMDCVDCPDNCKRTKDQVDESLYMNALIVLQELKLYKKWTVIKDTTATDVWATPAEIQYWIDNNIIDSAQDQCRDIDVFIKQAALEVNSTELGTTDNARAIAFLISFCDCVNKKPDFNYEFKAAAEKATTKCVTCS